MVEIRILVYFEGFWAKEKDHNEQRNEGKKKCIIMCERKFHLQVIRQYNRVQRLSDLIAGWKQWIDLFDEEESSYRIRFSSHLFLKPKPINCKSLCRKIVLN